MDEGRVGNGLNQAQRSAVRIALMGVERDLLEAQAWLGGQTVNGTLYRASLRLAPAMRAALLPRIAAALQTVALLAERLSLQPAAESVAARFAAKMTIDWADLVDIGSEKLRRYGAVDPDLKEALDPDLERLAQLASEISSLLRTSDPDGGQDEHARTSH